LLGAAVAIAGGLPANKVVFSKADEDPATGVFDGGRVRRSLDESLTRLGLDHIPLFHFHDPYGLTIVEAMASGGPVDALVQLRDEGVVGAIGIAAGTTALVEDYVRTDAFDAVLSHNRWTIVDRSADTIFDLATERGMAVFNAAPFGGGIVAGSDYRGATYGYRPASDAFLAHLERVRELCREWNVPIAAAALHFSLEEPRIHSTVVGIYSRERLDELAGLIATEVPSGFWPALDAVGIPPKSPNE
jgi:D-threo-aldose 1-dehydrogenase